MAAVYCGPYTMVEFEGSEASREILSVLIEELHADGRHIGGAPFLGPLSPMDSVGSSKEVYKTCSLRRCGDRLRTAPLHRAERTAAWREWWRLAFMRFPHSAIEHQRAEFGLLWSIRNLLHSSFAQARSRPG